jgi:hypothetical protein
MGNNNITHEINNVVKKSGLNFPLNSGNIETNKYMLIIGIVITISLVLLYLSYTYYKSRQLYTSRNPMLIGSPLNIHDGPKTFSNDNFPRSNKGLQFSYSTWIYIADWQYNFGKMKNIFIKGSVDPNNVVSRAPGLWLYPNKNSIHARIDTTAQDLETEGCDIDNVPLNKWVHIVYVLNNRVVNMYMDGKLNRSCNLNGIPIVNDEPLTIGLSNTYFGQIAKLQYYSHAVSGSDVIQLFTEGPFLTNEDKDQFYDTSNDMTEDELSCNCTAK